MGEKKPRFFGAFLLHGVPARAAFFEGSDVLVTAVELDSDALAFFEARVELGRFHHCRPQSFSFNLNHLVRKKRLARFVMPHVINLHISHPMGF